MLLYGCWENNSATIDLDRIEIEIEIEIESNRIESVIPYIACLIQWNQSNRTVRYIYYEWIDDSLNGVPYFQWKKSTRTVRYIYGTDPSLVSLFLFPCRNE